MVFSSLKPSSGIRPKVSCFGFLAMAPSGAGIPLEERQFKSGSFSRFYSKLSKSQWASTYDLEVGLELVGLWDGEALFIPVAYSKRSDVRKLY